MNGRTMKPGGSPRVLLVEDDAVSRAFLVDALAGAAAVVAVATAAAALEAVRHAGPFELWLLDAHLPDGNGIALLHRLRVHAPCTPALAHTADPDPALAAALRRAGFGNVLLKPLAARGVREAIGHALRQGGAAHAIAEAQGPAWPPALRRMFLAELPGQRDAIREALAHGDAAIAWGLLHRLRGSCALLGAEALDAAVRSLQSDPGCGSGLRAFESAVADLLGMEDAAEIGQQVP